MFSYKKTKYILYPILAIIGLLLLNSCKTATERIPVPTMPEEKILITCEELSKNFDEKIDSITKPLCDKWVVEKNPIWVGGTLVDVSKIYDRSFDRYVHRLTFQGLKTKEDIIINTYQTDTIPYKVGKFYKFDLANNCPLISSAASSGNFFDPDLNALEPVECN